MLTEVDHKCVSSILPVKLSKISLKQSQLYLRFC